MECPNLREDLEIREYYTDPVVFAVVETITGSGEQKIIFESPSWITAGVRVVMRVDETMEREVIEQGETL